jgi:hypothetical protein
MMQLLLAKRSPSPKASPLAARKKWQSMTARAIHSAVHDKKKLQVI